MDYFKRFDKVLNENFHGDFQAMTESTTRFDRYQGLPLSIREIDNRPKVAPVYVDIPEPVCEPPPEPEEIVDAFDFEVVDLEAEIDRRRKSTETTNPVQTETNPAIESGTKATMTLTPRVTKSSSRGVLSQTQKGEVPEFKVVFKGNRAQRKAAQAIHRRQQKHNNASGGKASNTNNSNAQAKGSPTVVNLSDLEFGFGME